MMATEVSRDDKVLKIHKVETKFWLYKIDLTVHKWPKVKKETHLKKWQSVKYLKNGKNVLGITLSNEI